jgi:hypothetical protein
MLLVAMHGFHREGRQANCEILGSRGFRRAVADPFVFVRDDSLSGANVERASGVLDAQAAVRHDSELVELRRLARLLPSARTTHVRDAHGGSAGVYAADVLVNEFWLGACGLDASGLRNKGGLPHEKVLYRIPAGVRGESWENEIENFMQKSQVELLALIAAVLASALALMLPMQYTWVTSISGFVLLFALFSYDSDAHRSAFQSVAFSAACGLGVMLLSVVYYRWLGGKGEIHMAGGRIETEWLPLTWLCASAGICAIDRIRMLGYKDANRHQTGAVQRGFIPQYAEPVAESKPAPQPVPQAPLVSTPPTAPPPSAVAGPNTPTTTPPVNMPLPPGKETEIYVVLVGEGLNLMRTVRAEHVGRDFYKIIEAMPEGETWEFGPGQVVRCKKRNLSTGKGLVAVEEAPRAS